MPQQQHYLSGQACLQLVRLAASKDHLAGAATQRLLASMPRLGKRHYGASWDSAGCKSACVRWWA